jgi:hypothetical protein
VGKHLWAYLGAKTLCTTEPGLSMQPNETSGSSDPVQGGAPSTAPTSNSSGPIRRFWDRRVGKVVAVISGAGALIGALQAIAGAPGQVIHLFHQGTPPLNEQLAAILKPEAAKGLSTAIKTADLQGTGVQSTIVIFTDTRDLPKDQLSSSEIAVFDVVGSGDNRRLVRSFDFKPELEAGIGLPWLFDLYEIGDVANDGRTELVGAFIEYTAAHPLHIPVAIRWDAGKGRYNVIPLIPARPDLLPPRDGAAAGFHDEYSIQVKLVDSSTHSVVRGYPTQDFGVVTDPKRGSVLVGAFVNGTRGLPVDSQLYQLVGFEIDFTGSYAGLQCSMDYGGRPILRKLPIAPLSSGAIAQAWTSARPQC